jgi:hypothetical protein
MINDIESKNMIMIGIWIISLEGLLYKLIEIIHIQQHVL